MKKCRFEGYVCHFDLEGLGFSEQYMVADMEAIENCDPSLTGEWVIEFGEDGKVWRAPFADVFFDFDNANKILCQLVQYDCIYVTDERHQKLDEETGKLLKGQGPFFLEVAKSEAAGFGSSREVTPGGTDVYRYLLKFINGLTMYRIRNKVTGELVMGDALICPK